MKFFYKNDVNKYKTETIFTIKVIVNRQFFVLIPRTGSNEKFLFENAIVHQQRERNNIFHQHAHVVGLFILYIDKSKKKTRKITSEKTSVYG